MKCIHCFFHHTIWMGVSVLEKAFRKWKSHSLVHSRLASLYLADNFKAKMKTDGNSCSGSEQLYPTPGIYIATFMEEEDDKLEAGILQYGLCLVHQLSWWNIVHAIIHRLYSYSYGINTIFSNCVLLKWNKGKKNNTLYFFNSSPNFSTFSGKCRRMHRSMQNTTNVPIVPKYPLKHRLRWTSTYLANIVQLQKTTKVKEEKINKKQSMTLLN